nr:immunoglobulin light chain junction region [Macaca mulatta]MPO08817.1 immunoglobulin light chain junction region [Macaca mulatta]MPO09206.1 immunoglobulin light chain junction region [Macaca mulatta]MPO09363.1 immunoglobulin light chain junction region [Macaca mulatta]MPO10733.1 immunoglobulin light chain junction region [Macaca mulatta]
CSAWDSRLSTRLF